MSRRVQLDGWRRLCHRPVHTSELTVDHPALLFYNVDSSCLFVFKMTSTSPQLGGAAGGSSSELSSSTQLWADIHQPTAGWKPPQDHLHQT